VTLIKRIDVWVEGDEELKRARDDELRGVKSDE